jgi:hypothetical protein
LLICLRGRDMLTGGGSWYMVIGAKVEGRGMGRATVAAWEGCQDWIFGCAATRRCHRCGDIVAHVARRHGLQRRPGRPTIPVELWGQFGWRRAESAAS